MKNNNIKNYKYFFNYKLFLKQIILCVVLISSSLFILGYIIKGFETEKTLILIIAYIIPFFFLFIIRYRDLTSFLLTYIAFCFFQFAIYWLFQDRWTYGLFSEQDSYLFLSYFSNVDLNPIRNYYDGYSNGALYLAFLKLLSYVLPIDLTIMAIFSNIFFMSISMVLLQKAINYRYDTNGIWAMKYLAISPLVHWNTFIALKDIMTMALIGIFLSILIKNGSKIKITLLSIAIFFNRVLVGVASIAAGLPFLAFMIVPVALYVLMHGEISILIKIFLARGEDINLIFPLSTLKFILTPLPHNSVDYYPSQFPMIFHIPFTLAAIFGFVKYAKISKYYFLIFIFIYLIISHFSPGNVRYRLMFEPFLALGFALFMQNIKIVFRGAKK